jgi:hypothetical protein
MNLRLLARVCGGYDLLLGLPMLLAPTLVARSFGAPEPQPVVNAQINGVFALALALGYFWAAREDARTLRGYLWIAGVFAKGLGSAVFVLDHVLRNSPSTFLLFAATDGALALWTLVALRSKRS